MARGNNDMTAEEIKEIIDKIKSDIDKKQGEREAVMKSLKAEYSMKNLDDLYKLLKKLNDEVDDASRERASLIAQASAKLKEFGY